MGIFNVNFSLLSQALLPPILRKDKEVSWLTALTKPLQNNNDDFNQYLTGSTTYSKYNVSSSYAAGNRIIYVDRGVYESISGSTAGQIPTNTNLWFQVNKNFIGVIEQSKFTCKKLAFENALNRWFMLPGFCPIGTATTITQALFAQSANTIYIQNNNVSSPTFVMGHTGPNSSYMVNNSFANPPNTFMPNHFLGYNHALFTIWVPNFIYSAVTDSGIRSFADQLNLGGVQYSTSGY
jgi:hypothetical protein